MATLKRIPLADVLSAVKEQLQTAHKKAIAEQDAIMSFSECEFEFAIEVEKKGKGKFDVYIAELGGELKRTDKNTVKIKYVSLETAEQFAAIQQIGNAPRKPTKRGSVPPEK